MNVGIVGLGRWGRILLRALMLEYRIKRISVTDIDSSVLLAVEQDDKVSHVGYDRLLDDQSITAVFVSTPASTHHAIAQQLLRAGKHLFIEKPLGLAVSETSDVLALARATDQKVFIDYTFLYEPFIKAYSAVTSRLGLSQPSSVQINRVNIDSNVQDCSVAHDLMSHDLAICHALFQVCPTVHRVSEWGTHVPNGYDAITADLTYSHSLVTLRSAWIGLHRVRTIKLTYPQGILYHDFTSTPRHAIFYEQGLSNVRIALGDELCNPVQESISEFLTLLGSTSANWASRYDGYLSVARTLDSIAERTTVMHSHRDRQTSSSGNG